MNEFDKLALELQPYYSHFNVANRLLFTGHSHQAWPDAAFDGIDEYMEMVAGQVDKKWKYAFEKTEILRDYLRNFYDDATGNYCREQNTHVLLVSWLSALDLKNKPRILTTSGEFHSMYRQLRSLQDAGLDVQFLSHQNDDKLYELVKHEVDDKTSAIMLSRIYYETAEINTRLSDIAQFAKHAGIPVLIDDYHGTNVVPLSLKKENMEHVYLLIGGYKYLQWGEANCFLRYPENCELKPVITGWFSAFQQLDQPRNSETVQFDDNDQKFATGTYDPISQYRAASVAQFFHGMGLTPDVLYHQYSSQISYLRDLFDEANYHGSDIEHANKRPNEETGGFLSLQSIHARKLREMLLEEEIFTDARDQIIRIGPAPYTTSQQCEKVIRELFRCLSAI